MLWENICAKYLVEGKLCNEKLVSNGHINPSYLKSPKKVDKKVSCWVKAVVGDVFQ